MVWKETPYSFFTLKNMLLSFQIYFALFILKNYKGGYILKQKQNVSSILAEKEFVRCSSDDVVVFKITITNYVSTS